MLFCFPFLHSVIVILFHAISGYNIYSFPLVHQDGENYRVESVYTSIGIVDSKTLQINIKSNLCEYSNQLTTYRYLDDFPPDIKIEKIDKTRIRIFGKLNQDEKIDTTITIKNAQQRL